MLEAGSAGPSLFHVRLAHIKKETASPEVNYVLHAREAISKILSDFLASPAVR